MKVTKEYIQGLRTLADRLESLDEETAKVLDLTGPGQYFFNKETIATCIRLLGGKWTKTARGGDAEYASLVFTSEKFPVTFHISRDKVCKKTVTFDCEPIFAPGEDDALVEESK